MVICNLRFINFFGKSCRFETVSFSFFFFSFFLFPCHNINTCDFRFSRCMIQARIPRSAKKILVCPLVKRDVSELIVRIYLSKQAGLLQVWRPRHLRIYIEVPFFHLTVASTDKMKTNSIVSDAEMHTCIKVRADRSLVNFENFCMQLSFAVTSSYTRRTKHTCLDSYMRI